jgi:hypothetical protein
MSFKQWYEDADMPTLQNGVWVDLETGIPYAESRAQRAPRVALSDKAQNARAVAKQFGGKALSGSAKQKEWAEKIRAEKLAALSEEQAILICDPTNILQNAKFWIENRASSGREIAAFEIQRRAALKRAKSLKAKNDADGYARAAGEYNDLTEKWGFK